LGSLSKDNLKNEAEEMIVEAVLLDDFLGTGTSINLIKMNVQGAEGFVIDGARNIIQQQLPMVVTEFWPEGLRNVNYSPRKFIEFFDLLGYEKHVLNYRTNEVSRCPPSLFDNMIDDSPQFARYLIFQHKAGSKYVEFANQRNIGLHEIERKGFHIDRKVEMLLSSCFRLLVNIATAILAPSAAPTSRTEILRRTRVAQPQFRYTAVSGRVRTSPSSLVDIPTLSRAS
jgi:hypothetical protein